MKNSCYGCSYYKDEEHYCNDRDCMIDPYDPECNYND